MDPVIESRGRLGETLRKERCWLTGFGVAAAVKRVYIRIVYGLCKVMGFGGSLPGVPPDSFRDRLLGGGSTYDWLDNCSDNPLTGPLGRGCQVISGL